MAGTVAEKKVGHTALPWKQNGCMVESENVQSRYGASSGGYNTVVHCGGERRDPYECEANASFIARACNSHGDLLAAAKKMLAFYNDLAKSNPGFMGKLTLQDYSQWNEAMIELPRAIAKAEGKQA